MGVAGSLAAYKVRTQYGSFQVFGEGVHRGGKPTTPRVPRVHPGQPLRNHDVDALYGMLRYQTPRDILIPRHLVNKKGSGGATAAVVQSASKADSQAHPLTRGSRAM